MSESRNHGSSLKNLAAGVTNSSILNAVRFAGCRYAVNMNNILVESGNGFTFFVAALSTKLCFNTVRRTGRCDGIKRFTVGVRRFFVSEVYCTLLLYIVKTSVSADKMIMSFSFACVNITLNRNAAASVNMYYLVSNTHFLRIFQRNINGRAAPLSIKSNCTVSFARKILCITHICNSSAAAVSLGIPTDKAPAVSRKAAVSELYILVIGCSCTFHLSRCIRCICIILNRIVVRRSRSCYYCAPVT